ncbi:MAG TPA: flagellar biosynthesis protein FlhF [Pirellulaceae bacterium]|nr:flagellar biosynthesis protein FlhF [Pirellulaceae bacterium]
MDLRTYRAKSLAEALRLVREDLGPEASVLHTRQVGSAAWRWLIGGEEIEVTASSEVQAPAILKNTSRGSPRADLLDFRAQFRRHLFHQQAPGVPSVEELASHAPHLASDGLPVLLERLGKSLMRQQLPAEAAGNLIAELQDAAAQQGLVRYRQLCQRLLGVIAGRLAVRGPIRLLPASRRIVALVGPTGVGKTTTAAKLAAHFHLREQQRVGLLTAESFRIAADTQLQAYAEIMNLPMEAVATPGEIPPALDRLADVDLVLVDTAGRSPRDAAQMRQLAEVLDQARPDEIHLVLSSASAAANANNAAESFARVGATSMILTKLDEVTALGGLWPLVCNRSLPIGYLASGQTVPHDLQPASRQELAELIAGSAIADGANGPPDIA